MVTDLLRNLSKAVAKILLILVAVEAVLAGVLQGATGVRNMLRGEAREGFPRGEWPEIELETGPAKLKLYSDYTGLYEAMLEEIERAESHVFFETFTFKVDEIGQRFVDALAKKAREGVRVYVIYDALASFSTSPDLFPDEVHVLPFRPLSKPTNLVNPHSFFRTHRKIFVVDGRVAFLGGFNLADDYRDHWRDTNVRIRGEEKVRAVESAFAGLWNAHRTQEMPEIEFYRQGVPKDRATVLNSNDPGLGLFPIRSMYVRPMLQARERIYLTSVYFVPSTAIEKALIDAANKGVDVQVIVPKQSSYAPADWLARRHFGPLLRAGVRIFEYDEHFVNHAKTATVDGVWSTVGSANIDSLSLFGLHEINLEVYSERFAEQMENMFEMDKTISEEVTLEAWENRPLYQKLVEGALAPIRPFA